MTRPPKRIRRPKVSDSSYFRSNPVWGANPATGPLVGPGPHGPDYSTPRSPQPGEGTDLLPQFQGAPADVAAHNAQRQLKTGIAPARRLAPYLTLSGTVTYNANADQQVVLGSPPKGFRWIVRQLLTSPGTNLFDNSYNSGAFFITAFFAGSAPTQHPAVATSQVGTLTDLLWTFSVKPSTVDAGAYWVSHQTFGPDQLVVLENQTLYGQVIQANPTGRPTLFLARVEQVPVAAVPRVEGI